MQQATLAMWNEHDRHPGDRQRLFTAIAGAFDIGAVLYPGSFVDIAPSFVFDSVTYADTDRRAAAFFGDTTGVDALIANHREAEHTASWRFLHADYTSHLDVDDGSVDLLVSLYAGPVSRYCTRYLAPGGLLLVNPSHGDAALASLDARYRLIAVVQTRTSDYHVAVNDLGSFLQPQRAEPVTVDEILATGRGVAYTKPAYAYVFRRVRDDD